MSSSSTSIHKRLRTLLGQALKYSSNVHKHREIPHAGSDHDIQHEYVISRYTSGHLTLDSLELMIVDKVPCVGKALMVIMRDILQNDGDISDIVEITHGHNILYLDTVQLLTCYGKEEHFKNNTLNIIDILNWCSPNTWINTCYVVSRERLQKVIGYVTSVSKDPHERLCGIIRVYSNNGTIDDNIMGALLEVLGGRELIYNPVHYPQLHEWLERMKDNQV